MEASFWHGKWERGEINFHIGEANPLLVAHFEELHLAKGSRVFLPLCGKTRDIASLLASGYRVAGAELSELAINALFKELAIEPTIAKVGKLTRYSAKDIDIMVGDIFDVSAENLGPIDAIYDRAALVALPASLRAQYTSHLMNITGAAPQLLISYEYDQLLVAGPPFSVTADEVKQHYGAAYQVKCVESRNVEGGLKGKVPSTESVWLLQKIATDSAEEIVQKQLDAYNARDMDAFLATYADEVALFRFPNTPSANGKEEMRKNYTARFSDTILHCIIVKRIVMGNTVIDHERIRVTLPEGPGVMEAIAIYEVLNGKIAKATFISGKKTPGEKL